MNNSNPLSNYGFHGRQQLAENVQFARTVNGVSGAAIAHGLDSFSNNNLNGFRGTFGLPVSTGTVELGGFVLQDSGNTYNGGNTLASVYESGVNRESERAISVSRSTRIQPSSSAGMSEPTEIPRRTGNKLSSSRSLCSSTAFLRT